MEIDLLLQILDNISEAVVMIDTQTKIVVYNKYSEVLLNRPAKEAMGKYIHEILPDSQLPDILITKKPLKGAKFNVNNRTCITNRFPIILNNILYGAVSIFEDMTDYEKQSCLLKYYKLYSKHMDVLVSAFDEMIVVVDNDGLITYISDAYREFVKYEGDPIGQHVKDVIPNTRMHIVAKTGVKEVGDIQIIHGKKMVPQRIPLMLEGGKRGAIGKVMYKDVSDLHLLYHKIELLEKELNSYKKQVQVETSAKYYFNDIIGEDEKMKHALKVCQKVSALDISLVITGESGTGKELIAHALHNASRRKAGPFIKVNCAAIPYDLLEAELFGYDEGAFTGAKRGGKPGKFLLADKGTILLDEIGDMPFGMQAKLLRVLQEKEVEKIGGNRSIPIDARVIASTNKDIENLVLKGEFREDLYYRLNVVNIKLPPLRERRNDVKILADHFRIKISQRLGLYVVGIDEEALQALAAYDWPGNIRELSNVMERTLIFMEGDTIIRKKHLPEFFWQTSTVKKNNEPGNYSLKSAVEALEKDMIAKVLDITEGNKVKAAEILEISRANLYKKIETYQL